jgi:replicative DNA helicase
MDNSNLHSDEAEVNVIASILVIQDNSKYINSLETQDFYSKTNKAIFSLMKELNDKDETVDLLTVKELGVTKKFNGIKLLETMTDMTDRLVYAGNIDKYIKILKNLSVKRKIFNTAKKVCEEISEVDPNKDEIEVKNEVVQKFLNIKTNKKNSNAEMKDVMIETLKDIDDKYQKRDDYSLRTGYLDLDKIIEGLHEQELTLLGARPGVGKTAFSLQMAEHIAKKGVYVYFVSLEMSRKQLGNRIIAREAEIDSHVLRMGWLTEENFAKINEVAGNVADIKMCIDSESTTIQDIEDKANELKQEKNLGLMVIDYLQLLKSRNKFTNREQEVADISRRLKLLSKELNIPVVALCQLNRETEKRRRPLLADLRESGSLEQDADNVIFLYVDDEEKVKNRVIDVEVIVAKQRNGPTRNGKDSI